MRVRAETQWTSLDLSPVGVKMPPQAWIEPGATVSLLFALPDGGAPLHLKAVFSRAETDGHIFTFVNLSDAEFKRLADYSRRATTPPVTVRPAPPAPAALSARADRRQRTRGVATRPPTGPSVPVFGASRRITTLPRLAARPRSRAGARQQILARGEVDQQARLRPVVVPDGEPAETVALEHGVAVVDLRRDRVDAHEEQSARLQQCSGLGEGRAQRRAVAVLEDLDGDEVGERSHPAEPAEITGLKRQPRRRARRRRTSCVIASRERSMPSSSAPASTSGR